MECFNDEMDEVMSQTVIEGDLREPVSGNFSTGALDEMDHTMSQMVYEDYVDDEVNGDEMDGCASDIPLAVLEQYENAIGETMPTKSVIRYVQTYDVFVEWQKKNRTESFDEKVLVAYFSSIGERYSPSTLWSKYSMLRRTLIWKHNVDISNYCQLRAWLKQKNNGYQCKQSNVFEPEDIARFVVEAPNNKYLAVKAVLGVGVIGVCRGDELTKLTVENVIDTGKDIIIKVPNTKSKRPKTNVIDGEFTNIIREYIKLRPPNVPTNRFFLQYRNGKCTSQVIGKNMIAKMPKIVATFLQLKDPGSYTGHSYRRTGTTIAANSGASFEQIKRIGDWTSTTVCERYIQESLGQKRKLAKMISGSIDLPSSVETQSTSGNMELPDSVSKDVTLALMSNSSIPSIALSSSVSSSDLHHTINADVSSTSLGIQIPDDKRTVIFHFAKECSNFTFHNMKCSTSNNKMFFYKMNCNILPSAIT